VDAQGRIQWIQEAIARVGSDVLAHRCFHALLLHSPGMFFQRSLVDPSSLNSAASCADLFAQIWLQLFRHAQPLPVDALLGCSRFGVASGIDDLLLQAAVLRLLELPEVRDRKTLRPLCLPDALDVLRGQQRRLDRQAFFDAEEVRQQDKGDPGVLTRFLLEGYAQNRWRELAGPARQSMRIALFGAGIHTHWLLGVVKNVPGPRVVAILDDFADTGNAIAGIPIERPVGFDVRRIDAIVLSSDTSARKFEERVRALFGPVMRICKLYEGLPPGPYPKQLAVP
ncbi:MAG: hypothetical protein WCN95_15985, partial [bacterium]